ncbi:MAG: DUF433 domain-containing protein [Deltaproteobacteria bacterium]|nr:MAG: DUF433 domain-containing protein [Deltaproteobacteria bacterium]
MAASANIKPTIIRTSRGLSVGGTRTTLYQIMDCLRAGIPHIEICDRFRLTLLQMDDILRYIEKHKDETEKEYQEVRSLAEEHRRYWEEKNQEHFAKIAGMPRTLEQENIWRKLQAWKQRINLELSES